MQNFLFNVFNVFFFLFSRYNFLSAILFFSIYRPKTQQHTFDLIMTFANVETSSRFWQFVAIFYLKMFLRDISSHFFIVKCFSKPLLLRIIIIIIIIIITVDNKINTSKNIIIF